MKIKLFLSIAAAALWATRCALAEAGWNDTRWGMTIAEVQNIYPTARSLKETTPRRARLQIDQFKIGREPYAIRFFFDSSERLYEVTLTLDDPDARIAPIMAEIASDYLRGKLAEKYGATTAIDHATNNHRWMWVRDDLVVTLSYIPSGPLVMVSYAKPDEETMKKL